MMSKVQCHEYTFNILSSINQTKQLLLVYPIN